MASYQPDCDAPGDEQLDISDDNLECEDLDAVSNESHGEDA